MARHARPKERRQEPLLHRLEQAAANINPFLIIVAAGLAILDLSVCMALQMPRVPLH